MNSRSSDRNLVLEGSQSSTQDVEPTSCDSLIASGSSRDDLPNVLERIRRALGPEDLLALLVPDFHHESRETLKRRVLIASQRAIAWIDQAVTKQLNAIIHSKKFQRLEASWRGLYHLQEIRNQYPRVPCQILVLNATWLELQSDLEESIAVEQSCFFKRVHDDYIGVPGGNPMSVLILDFDFNSKPANIAPLRKMCQVSRQSLLPVVGNASAEMFKLDSFRDLSMRVSSSDPEQLQSKAWKHFREDENSRYLTLALPRILMRSLIREDYSSIRDYIFREKHESADDYLWGGAAWGVGEVLIRNFAEHGWFINIRGMEQGVVSYGVVHGPAEAYFENEPNAASPKSILETMITDRTERTISKLGLTVLCSSKFTTQAVLYSVPTVNKPKVLRDAETSVNYELSSLLNYVLSACRLGHGIKVMARDWTGSDKTQNSIQTKLNDWLIRYKNPSMDAPMDDRAKKPLIDCDVEVTSVPRSPGEYNCRIQLQPFHGIDNFSAKLILETTVLNKATG
jgi:type VI secretion system ImpC/EvpB family protein